jgi:hypothetical protein
MKRRVVGQQLAARRLDCALRGFGHEFAAARRKDLKRN